MIETLLDDPDSPPAMRQRFLEKVITQTERMGNLVNDLLSLSRLESESGVFEIQPIDLRQPVKDSARLLQPAREARKVDIDCRMPEEPVWVDGDEEGLRQAMGNLLDNAIKYSPEGGTVEIRVRISDSMATVEVRDRGPGIAAHHQERLFERFYRVDKARSRALGGTGLGLAIVKHTALAHGGMVSVDSTPGRGSTFRIEIPLSKNAP
jgi:signal transduction histidine kinase